MPRIRIMPDQFRANATEINKTPQINPLVLVFETVEGFQHCMTYIAAERSLKKNPICMYVFRIKGGEFKTGSKMEMRGFLDAWREDYFNPEFMSSEVKDEKE